MTERIDSHIQHAGCTAALIYANSALKTKSPAVTRIADRTGCQ